MFLNRLRFFHFWLHFLLHFGVILGAKFVTILLLVARVTKTGSQNTGKKTEEKKVIFWVPAGGCDMTVGARPGLVFINIWAQNGGFA